MSKESQAFAQNAERAPLNARSGGLISYFLRGGNHPILRQSTEGGGAVNEGDPNKPELHKTDDVLGDFSKKMRPLWVGTSIDLKGRVAVLVAFGLAFLDW